MSVSIPAGRITDDASLLYIARCHWAVIQFLQIAPGLIDVMVTPGHVV